MAYKVIILYQLYMPSYFLGTFTEYPYLKDLYDSIKIRIKARTSNYAKAWDNIGSTHSRYRTGYLSASEGLGLSHSGRSSGNRARGYVRNRDPWHMIRR